MEQNVNQENQNQEDKKNGLASTAKIILSIQPILIIGSVSLWTFITFSEGDFSLIYFALFEGLTLILAIISGIAGLVISLILFYLRNRDDLLTRALFVVSILILAMPFILGFIANR